MFNGCSSLRELNLSHFIANNLINMNQIFDGLSSGISLICIDNSIRKEYEKIFK